MSKSRVLVGAAVLLASVVVGTGQAAAACTDAPAPGVDWSNCPFSSIDFTQLDSYPDVDLSNANLRGIDLSYAVLFQGDFSGADLRGANLRDAFLIRADLSGADLTGADLSDADLVGANLDNAVLVDTNLSRSDVDRSSIAGASFVSADLALADFSDVSGAGSAVFGLAPTAITDDVLTWEDRAVTFDLLANDDPGDTNAFARASVEILTRPENGTVSGTRYTPDPGFSGSDRFTYRMVDTLEWENVPAGVARTYASAPVTVEIQVNPTIDVGPPYAGATGIEGEIVRLYVALLRRVPDEGGFRFWVSERTNGRTLASVASSFQASSEFLDANADLTSAEFVTLLYNNVLERQPDRGGLDFWIGQLDSGAQTTDQVVLAFTESSEFKVQTKTS